MKEIKTFKRYGNAKAAAKGNPVIRVGNLYLVVEDDLIGIRLTEASIINPDGVITGHVTMGHLDRLGNANGATSKDVASNTFKRTSFPKEKAA